MFAQKPSQRCNRATVGGASRGTPWTNVQNVLESPGWLLSLAVSIEAAAGVDVYALLFDLPGNAPDPTNGDVPILSLGPIVPGGLLLWEPEELVHLDGLPTFRGYPFDTGLRVVASTTPGVLALVESGVLQVRARVQQPRSDEPWPTRGGGQ